MSPHARAMIVFSVTVASIAVAIWVNIRLARRCVGKWDGYSSFLFYSSLGQFGELRKARWISLGYTEGDASTIIKFQTLCLSEIPIGFIVSVASDYYFIRPWS